ncbi:hypothetical protein Taro_054975 [Colocasia esculenta]|uniref:Uncharacterized protein n=1 Tax=Colocasia esculenta TaxID=4460 RepID=A0A843XPU6_COLES|nr:hypothetical protein [Colocasia esculenta]
MGASSKTTLEGALDCSSTAATDSSKWPDATPSSTIPSVSEVTGVMRTESTTSLRMEAITEVDRLSVAPTTASSSSPSGDCETAWIRGGECGASWNQDLTHYEVEEAVERIQLVDV